MTWIKLGRVILPLSIILTATRLYRDPAAVSAQSPVRFVGPTSSAIGVKR